MKNSSFHIRYIFLSLLFLTVCVVGACSQDGLTSKDIKEGREKIIVIDKPNTLTDPLQTQSTLEVAPSTLETIVEEVTAAPSIEPITEQDLQTEIVKVMKTPIMPIPAEPVPTPNSKPITTQEQPEPVQPLNDPAIIHQSSLPDVKNDTCPQDDTIAYRMGAEDEMLITVFGENDLSGKFKIQNTGSVTLPLIGETRLSGCTIAQAEALLTSKYSDGYLVSPSIAITISQYRPYYIIGEVKEPGRYDYVVDMSVLQAVALAGGYTYRANKSTAKILVSHKNGEAVYEQRPVTEKVRPGDVILIKERFF